MEKVELEEERIKLNSQYEIFLMKHGNPITQLELKLLIFLRELDKLPDRIYSRDVVERIPLDKFGKEIPLDKDGKPEKEAKSWKTKAHTVKVVGKDRQHIDFWVLRTLFPQISKYHLEKKLRFRYGLRQRPHPKTPDILKVQRQWRKPPQKRSFDYQVKRAMKGFIFAVKGLKKDCKNKPYHPHFNEQVDHYIRRLEDIKL